MCVCVVYLCVCICYTVHAVYLFSVSTMVNTACDRLLTSFMFVAATVLTIDKHNNTQLLITTITLNARDRQRMYILVIYVRIIYLYIV